MAPGGLRSWLSSPAFLSLQRPSGTAQVSGTMDPLKEGTKLCGKFETNLLKTPFSGSQLQRVEIVGSRFNSRLADSGAEVSSTEKIVRVWKATGVFRCRVTT